MKKKLLGTIMAFVLSAATAVTAFAASKVGEIALPGSMEGQFKLEEITKESYSALAEKAPEVVDAILAINAGTKTIESIKELAPEHAAQLEGKSALGKFVGLSALDAAEKSADGKYVVTLSVPALSDAVSDVKILHYSTERSVWEIIIPTKIDTENKQITAEFEDLSPVAVIANVDSTKAADVSNGTSPKTGVGSYSAWFFAAAVALGGAAVVCFRKKKTAADQQ